MYWVMATLLVALLPQFVTMPVYLVAITLAPIAWRWMAELRRWKPLPTWLRLPATIGSLVVLVATYGNLLGRRAAVGLLAVMLAIKLLETFRVRDARIVTSLTLFFCATQFLFNQGLLMLVYGAAVMLGALAALALISRHEAFSTIGRAAPTGRGVFGELTFGSRLMLLAIPLGLALFMFFPRWGSPLWGIPERSLDSKTGLSDSMTPGSIQSLFMDDSPAFRAVFRTQRPRPQDLYWRGPVLWNFDGQTWETSYLAATNETPATPSAATSPYVYEVQLEPHERKWLFALDVPAIAPPIARRISTDFQLIARRPVVKLTVYEMASDPDFLMNPRLERTFRSLALDLPEGSNPRTRELMERWRAETPTDAALVRRALTLFNGEPFRYTLNPPLLSEHTVDEFLFDTQSGFCEHYASAFAVMMRMAGIPSRVVTGYQGGWYAESGDYVLVRQSDAHAWAEVWLEGVGWTRIDPTAAVAPSRIENGALDALEGRRHFLDYPWLREVRNGLDRLNRAWNDWVIAFDAARQSGMLDFLGIERLGTRALVGLLAVALVLGSLLLLPWLLRLERQREPDPVVRQWRRFLRRLAKAGAPVTSSMGPLEVSAAAAGHAATRPGEVSRLARAYLELRYASRETQRDALIRDLRRYRPARDAEA